MECHRVGLIALVTCGLAACGDNLAAPRVAAARYVYDDHTEQIDRRSLYDRTLASLCEPRRFSDGAAYCAPAADDAFFVDEHCVRAVGRVPTGTAPRAFFQTTYTMQGTPLPSRLFAGGQATAAPLQRWVRSDIGCVAFPLDDGYDYYTLGAELTDLPHIRFVDGQTGTWKTVDVVADGLRLPWRIAGCTIEEAANQPSTVCVPDNAAMISYFSDPACTMPVIAAATRPELAYVRDAQSGCSAYFGVGNELSMPALWQKTETSCASSTLSGASRFFTVAHSMQLPALDRTSQGPNRLAPIALGDAPIPDRLLHDSRLATDCRRDAMGRCVPATDAKVVSWFSDDLCGTPVDVAMVAEGGCNSPTMYAQRGDAYYPIQAAYTGQLYQLEPGDRCGTYSPPAPLIAHTIGPALGDEAFARATLMIE